MSKIEDFKHGKSVSLLDDVTARLIRAADMSDIHEMLGDDRVTTYLFFAPAPPEVYDGFFGPIIEETAQALEKGEAPANIVGVLRDGDGKFLGNIGLTPVALHDGNYELGYQLAHAAWGRGLATAGCRFLAQLAFEGFGAHKIAADCYMGNVGSWRVMEKCGFAREGVQKSYYKTDNGFDDRVLYGLTRDEFRAL